MPPDVKKPFTADAAAWLRDLWPAALTVIGPLILGLTQLAGDDGHVPVPGHPTDDLVFAVGAALSLVGAAASGRRSRRISRIEYELAAASSELERTDAAIASLAMVELELIAKDLGYWSAERVTLFLETDDCFELVARHSANQEYRCAGRDGYSKKVGCLGEAWRTGSDELVVAARRGPAPDTWAAGHATRGVSRDDALGLTMPVRTVVAIRIDDPRVGRKALGVLVLESEQTAGDSAVGGRPSAILRHDDIARKLEDHERRLAGILSVLAEQRAAGTALRRRASGRTTT